LDQRERKARRSAFLLSDLIRKNRGPPRASSGRLRAKQLLNERGLLR
jgi:hypothetical protein